MTPLATPAKPGAPRHFAMYVAGEWYALAAREPEADGMPPARRLDVSLLSERVLGPVLGIGDPRTDKRIDFVGGARGLAELARRVDSGEMAAPSPSTRPSFPSCSPWPTRAKSCRPNPPGSSPSWSTG